MIGLLLQRVRACGAFGSLLLCTDGLSSYPKQALSVMRYPERTVARWRRESGYQCRRVHEHLVQAGGVLLAQAQADELRVRTVGGVFVAGFGDLGY